jgi:hypothetical protein
MEGSFQSLRVALGVASAYPSTSHIYWHAVVIAIQHLEARTAQSTIRHLYHWAGYAGGPDQPKKEPLDEEEASLRSDHSTQKRRVNSLPISDLRQPIVTPGRGTIHSLLLKGDEGMVEGILRAGDVSDRFDSPDEADICDLTPLHYACQHGHENVVELLLKHGARVDAQSLDGSTPLHLASLNGRGTVVDILTQHNPSTRLIRNSFGRLPIHCAAMNGHSGLVERWSVDAGALDDGALDGREQTALHYAAWFGRASVLQVLLRSSPDSDVDPVDSTALTPLHFAAHRGHAEAVENLSCVAPMSRQNAACVVSRHFISQLLEDIEMPLCSSSRRTRLPSKPWMSSRELR